MENTKAKKILIYFFILFLGGLFGCTSVSDCSKYKNGSFYMFSPVTKDTILIERKDGLQIERNLRTGTVSKNLMTWEGACIYKLVSVPESKLKGTDSFLTATPVYITIVERGEQFYIFKTALDSADKYLNYSDTVWLKRSAK
jgi:hypothetical protein